METRTARESCDTTYYDAKSSAGDETASEQGSAAHEGSVASETPHHADGYQIEWLSELIGRTAASGRIRC